MHGIFEIMLALWPLLFAACDSNANSEILPAPIVALNLTQDSETGTDRSVYRRLASRGSKDTGESEIAPLFEGLGTHYSFIWVGSPPQRVSVIMDTGSHHTAFPCVGCKCGKHMDPHFDPKRSSTSSIKKCGKDGRKCYFKQSYTEGSSWSAYRVQDKVWIGGPGAGDIPHASDKSIDFSFGCQESETGLFRTQKVDGIMGLSAAADTYPFQLQAKGLAKTKMFGLCYRTGGGIVTLGGADTTLHESASSSSRRQTNALPSEVRTNDASSRNAHRGLRNEAGGENVSTTMTGMTAVRTSTAGFYFAKMVKSRGWYTVKMLDILMRSPSSRYQGSYMAEDDHAGGSGSGSGVARSIKGDASRYNGGKGVIVDSGTTDTYLPSAVRRQFQMLFKQFAGRDYNNRQIALTKEQLVRLPIIIFRLLGADGRSVVDVEVFPHSYLEHHRNGKYTPRIYLTEGSGTVLGANAMNEHNVVFDADNLRVGFAKARCVYTRQMTSHDFSTSTNSVSSSLSSTKTTSSTNKKSLISSIPKKVPIIKEVKKGKGNNNNNNNNNNINNNNNPFAAMQSMVSSRSSGSNSQLVAKSYAKWMTPVSMSAALQEGLSDAIAAAVKQFTSTYARNACKPTLHIPCSARCSASMSNTNTHASSPSTTAAANGGGGGGGGGELFSESTTGSNGPGVSDGRYLPEIVEYLSVSSQGHVSVKHAYIASGQQYWKIPRCDTTSSSSSIEKNYLSSIQKKKTLDVDEGDNRRLGNEKNGGFSINFPDLNLGESGGPEGDGSRIEMAECSIYCPISNLEEFTTGKTSSTDALNSNSHNSNNDRNGINVSEEKAKIASNNNDNYEQSDNNNRLVGGVGSDLAATAAAVAEDMLRTYNPSAYLLPQSESTSTYPIRINAKTHVEETMSKCDPLDHSRKYLLLGRGNDNHNNHNHNGNNGGERTELTVASKAGNPLCYSILNSKLLPPRNTGSSSTSSLSTTISTTTTTTTTTTQQTQNCIPVQVMETPCRPYSFNCTIARNPQGIVPQYLENPSEEVVVVLHWRIKRMLSKTLASYQEMDIIRALVELLQLPPGSISLVSEPSTHTALPFHMHRTTVIKAFLKVKPKKLLPKALLKQADKILKSRKSSQDKTRAQRLYNQISQDYLQELVQDPSFPRILTDTMRRIQEQSSNSMTTKNQWVVASSITFDRATLQLEAHDEIGDKLNAGTCVSVYARSNSLDSWAGYFGAGSGDVISSTTGSIMSAAGIQSASDGSGTSTYFTPKNGIYLVYLLSSFALFITLFLLAIRRLCGCSLCNVASRSSSSSTAMVAATTTTATVGAADKRRRVHKYAIRK